MTICWTDVRDRAGAALATLHVGIEPVILTLLVERGAIAAADGGWVVGAGQLGMSAGALLCWRSRAAARRPAALAAAAAGIVASLALALCGSLATTLLLRLALGAAMGLLLARATAAAARTRPHRAIGTIVLGQQGLAALVMLALPAIAAWQGATVALAMLAAVPVVLGLLVLPAAIAPIATVPAAVPPPAPARLFWPHLAAMALLIASTLMVWSYLGMAGARIGMAAHAADVAIAVASLSSIPAGLVATLHAPRHAPAATALACGLAILAPLLLPPGGGVAGFVAAMVLFNAGATFAVIRCSAWAMARCGDARARRLVTLVQCAAMAGGAPLGAMAIGLGGLAALTALAALCAALATGALLAPRWRSEPGRAAAAGWGHTALPAARRLRRSA